MSNVSTESELTQTADFCLHFKLEKSVISIEIMNSRNRIHFILLFIQYYDMQVQNIAARTDAAETKVLFCMLTTFLEMARNSLLAMKEYRPKKSPLIWRKERSSLFWEKECRECSALDFKNILSLERRSFFELCDILNGIGKEDTNFRKAITLEKRAAIALYALGTSAEYRTVASLFGVSNSCVCRIVREFCVAAWNALKPNYLNYFPLTETVAQTIVNDFNNMGFPQCIGALDGCHIEVKPKKEDATTIKDGILWCCWL